MVSRALHRYRPRPLQVAGRLWRLLQSREVALAFLIALAVLVTLGATIPQRAWFGAREYTLWRAGRPAFADLVETLGLNQVFSSWGFYALVALGTLSLAAVSVRRAVSFLSAPEELSVRAWHEAQGCRNGDTLAVATTAQETVEEAQTALRARSYRVAAKPLGLGYLLYAEKGLVGTWGSILFHLSFVLLLLGGVVSALVRFDGWMVLTEGQTLTDSPKDYLATAQGPLRTQGSPAFSLRLDKFLPTYYRERLGVDYTSFLSFPDANRGERRAVTRLNHPVRYGGAAILMESYGFAPLFSLRDGEGKETFRSYVNLVAVTVDGRAAEDMFRVPNTDLLVKVRIYPDFVADGDEGSTASLLPRRPVLALEVDDLRNEPTRGLVSLGGSLPARDFSLSFGDLRYWVRFRVVKDPGEPLIFAAFALGILGIGLRYLFLRKQVWALVQENGEGTLLALKAQARPCDALYAEEVNGIVEELRERDCDG